MRLTILYSLFFILLVFTLILFTVYNLIDSNVVENKPNNVIKYTGLTKNIEVSHEDFRLKFIHSRTTKRFDDKFFNYLLQKQEARENTFMKGKVFLKEK